ncbi:MAG: hypothetical protein ABIN58_05175 [candidate division WOR-3 bacterium]
MREQHYETHHVLNLLLDECADMLGTIVAHEAGEGPLVERVRQRIDALFRPARELYRAILPSPFAAEVLETIRPRFRHRDIEMEMLLETTRPIFMPDDSLRKVVVGLVKNAIENTPDQGKIHIASREKGNGKEQTCCASRSFRSGTVSRSTWSLPDAVISQGQWTPAPGGSPTARSAARGRTAINPEERYSRCFSPFRPMADDKRAHGG